MGGLWGCWARQIDDSNLIPSSSSSVTVELLAVNEVAVWLPRLNVPFKRSKLQYWHKQNSSTKTCRGKRKHKVHICTAENRDVCKHAGEHFTGWEGFSPTEQENISTEDRLKILLLEPVEWKIMVCLCWRLSQLVLKWQRCRIPLRWKNTTSDQQLSFSSQAVPSAQEQPQSASLGDKNWTSNHITSQWTDIDK